MSRFRRALGWDPLLFGTLALAVFVAAILIGWQASTESDPPPLRTFAGETVGDDAGAADVAGVVSDRRGDVITVQDASGPIDIALDGGGVIQTLDGIEPSDVRAGDWLIVGGEDDNVNTFIVNGVIVLDPSEIGS